MPSQTIVSLLPTTTATESVSQIQTPSVTESLTTAVPFQTQPSTSVHMLTPEIPVQTTTSSSHVMQSRKIPSSTPSAEDSGPRNAIVSAL